MKEENTFLIFNSNYRFGQNLRDSLLFDFGALLMSKDSFWVFGIDYLEQCSTEGVAAIELFLSKMSIKNEKHAMKIINIAKNKGLVEVGKLMEYEILQEVKFKSKISILEKELCRVQAIKSFNNGRYGNALDWALRSQDNSYVTSIADLFLRVCQTFKFLKLTLSMTIELILVFVFNFQFPIALHENRRNTVRRCDNKYRCENVYLATFGVFGEIL